MISPGCLVVHHKESILHKTRLFETDLCEECEVKQDVKHILLYCNSGILQESWRIFTNNYKQYILGFVNLCDDKKLQEILNVHQKCNEICIDVATEEICKFI